MLIVTSKNGVPIRLTRERWEHIVRRHLEMATEQERVLETVEEPEFIQRGDFGELLAVRPYEHTPLTRKLLVVVYREVTPGDGYVLAAYLTSRPSSRRATTWKH